MFHRSAQMTPASLRNATDSEILMQGIWNSEVDGRYIACVLGVMHPTAKTVSECRSPWMPRWLTGCIPFLFDEIPLLDIQSLTLEWADLLPDFPRISVVGWERIRAAFLIHCIKTALETARPREAQEPPAYWPAVETACNRMMAALETHDRIRIIAARSAAIDAIDKVDVTQEALPAAYAARAASDAPYAVYAAAYASAEAVSEANGGSSAVVKKARAEQFKALMQAIQEELIRR